MLSERVGLAVRRMLFIGVPKATGLVSNLTPGSNPPVCFEDFIRLVLLVAYMEIPGADLNVDLDLVELFAGRARLSRMAGWCGYRARALDIRFHPTPDPSERKRGKPRRSS